MPKFNHACDFAFEVKTDNDPDKVTAARSSDSFEE